MVINIYIILTVFSSYLGRQLSRFFQCNVVTKYVRTAVMQILLSAKINPPKKNERKDDRGLGIGLRLFWRLLPNNKINNINKSSHGVSSKKYFPFAFYSFSILRFVVSQLHRAELIFLCRTVNKNTSPTLRSVTRVHEVTRY